MQSNWDANAYWSSGGIPWTFFAYPRVIADPTGLPPDQRACDILALLQSRGLRVGPFTNSPVHGTAYLACHKDDIESLQKSLQEMGVWGYCLTRSQELLDSLTQGT